MAENTETPGGEDNAGDLRGTLVKRLAVAGVLVAVLLGVLAFFDYLATAPEEPEQQVFTQPVPVAPKKEVSQPVKPAESLPEPPTETAAAPPAVEAQPPAVAEARTDTEAASEKRPIPSTPSVAKATPSAPQPAAPVRLPRALPEGTASPSVAPDQPPTLTKPSPRTTETRAAQPVTAPVVSRLFAGFLLQAGVFSSAQRAEELHAKLTLSGVPSTLETRVQVGPFRTRQEAEAAQAKLKELGIEAILIPPKGGRS